MLVKAGAFVTVATTPSTSRFVGSATFSALASEPVYDDLWDNRGSIAHTTLGRSSDLIIVAPATATTIAKMAQGIGDDIVTATLLCTPSTTPVVVAPAMHEEMYDHVATQENVATLLKRGVTVVGPVDGQLAGGDVGRGRMSDEQEIFDAAVAALENVPLKGGLAFQKEHFVQEKTLDTRPVILITAGGTREPIDPVRMITNRSSGAMGHALAQAANVNGYHVILITTSMLVTSPEIERIDVETAEQMHVAVMKYLDAAKIVIMTAAVADIRPSHPSSTKLKRSEGIANIEVEPTADIIADIVSHKNQGTFVACFAAETNDVVANARIKFEAKGVDMLIANDISRDDSGFGSDTNKVWIFSQGANEPDEMPTMLKEELAYEIMERIGCESISS